MNTNILVLAAGPGGLDPSSGNYPVCLTELDGVSVLERVVAKTLTIQGAQHCFAILSRDAERFHLDRVVTLLVSGARVVKIPESTKGSACTALLAAIQLPQGDDLLIVSANEIVDVDLAAALTSFRSRDLDGGTLTFRSVHPRYSYLRLDAGGLVVEAAQQKPISNHATAGVFWFRRTGDFVEAAKALIRKNASVGGQFFVAPAYNELVLKQRRIGIIELDVTKYHPLKTERQVQQFEHGGAS
jgi:hypothetical protein